MGVVLDHRQTLSFVADTYVVGKKKWLEMVIKWPYVSRKFW